MQLVSPVLDSSAATRTRAWIGGQKGAIGIWALHGASMWVRSRASAREGRIHETVRMLAAGPVRIALDGNAVGMAWLLSPARGKLCKA